MNKRRHVSKAAVAVIAACGLLLSTVVASLVAQTSTTQKPAAAAPAPASTAQKPSSAAPKPASAAPGAPQPAAPTEIDGGWPRDYDMPNDGALRVFQPQIATWDGQKHMVAYSAVSYSAKALRNSSTRRRAGAGSSPCP